jgi:hypothetical protein
LQFSDMQVCEFLKGFVLSVNPVLLQLMPLQKLPREVEFNGVQPSR